MRAGHTSQGVSDLQPLVPYKSSPKEAAATFYASTVNIFIQILDTEAEKQILYTLKEKYKSYSAHVFFQVSSKSQKIYHSSEVLVLVSR